MLWLDSRNKHLGIAGPSRRCESTRQDFAFLGPSLSPTLEMEIIPWHAFMSALRGTKGVWHRLLRVWNDSLATGLSMDIRQPTRLPWKACLRHPSASFHLLDLHFRVPTERHLC